MQYQASTESNLRPQACIYTKFVNKFSRDWKERKN